MKERLDFFSSLLFSVICCLLLFDTVLWITGSIHQFPANHKNIMLTWRENAGQRPAKR